MDKNFRFPFRFFIITFTWSWLIWIPLVLGSLGIIPFPNKLLNALRLPLTIIAAFGPFVGALFTLHREQGKGFPQKYLRTFLDIHFGWKAYIFPLVILGGSTFVAWFLPELFGMKRLSMLLPSAWLFIPYLLIMVFLGGGQEEFGWRGYALPLLEKRFGLWLSNIILGIIWACWHLPLWFIKDSDQSYMNFGGFILLTIGYSFIFSWIRSISGFRPLSGLYTHGVANAFVPLMPILILQKNV
ncbi:MAG: type II CAAX endopeptidase family protein, partial [Bacteroidota bacterium]|nr:type II CAAX endopeptidase family protein [Bacteroidota bacterium]